MSPAQETSAPETHPAAAGTPQETVAPQEPMGSRPEHFLPVALDELTRQLIETWQGPDASALEGFCRRYAALHSARMASRVGKLKRSYRCFDPDADTVSLHVAGDQERDELRLELHADVTALLKEANYVEISSSDLQAALNKTSPRGLLVSVDLDEFDELSLHYRGAYLRIEETRDWRRLYLSKRRWETPVYRRLFLMLKLRENPDDDRGERIFMKLFRDVPQSDLEMLLPNTRVRMRLFDKLKLGITGGGGTAGGIVATATKLGAAASPTTWALALAGLAGVLWRQVAKVLAQRTRYMADLAQQLYFCNLDNNLGALVHLVDLAHAEEGKEALLAYVELAASGAEGLTRDELDRRVEQRLSKSFGVTVNYEIDDGVAKLEQAALFVPREDGRLQVVEPHEAEARLAAAWNNF